MGYISKQYLFFDRIKNHKCIALGIFLIPILIAGVIVQEQFSFNYNFIKLFFALTGSIIIIIGVCNFEKAFNYFFRLSRYSLPLYLFNGYTLVISRTIICKLIDYNIEYSTVVVFFNLIFDFFAAYLIIKYVFCKSEIIKKLIGVG